MKTTTRARLGLGLAAVMTTFGAGLIAAPLMVTASATDVNRTPTNSYEKAYFGDNWDNAMHADYWCPDGGTKIDGDGETTTFDLPVDTGKLVIHAGTWIFVWTPADAGTYGTPVVEGKQNPQGVSWAIYCDTTTSTAPSTTEPGTTEPGTTAPETSEPAGSESSTTGGSLAHTGGSNVGMLVGLGALLLAGGAATMVASRRKGSHA